MSIRENPKRRYPTIHESHVMGEVFGDVRCPCSTPRFYSVRQCTLCGAEEIEHAAGYRCDSALKHICTEAKEYKKSKKQIEILEGIQDQCIRLIDCVPLDKSDIKVLSSIHKQLTEIKKSSHSQEC